MATKRQTKKLAAKAAEAKNTETKAGTQKGELQTVDTSKKAVRTVDTSKKELQTVDRSKKAVQTVDTSKKELQTVDRSKKAVSVVKKKTTALATVSEKPAPKRAALKETLFVQYGGKELSSHEALAMVKEDWVSKGRKVKDLKSLSLYVKPEENAVYYVANEDPEEKGVVYY